MEYLNTDTATLVMTAELGCSVERLREAYAGLEKRTRTISQIKSLVQTYGQLGSQTVES